MGQHANCTCTPHMVLNMLNFSSISTYYVNVIAMQIRKGRTGLGAKHMRGSSSDLCTRKPFNSYILYMQALKGQENYTQINFMQILSYKTYHFL